MLTPEQAQKELEKVKVENWEVGRVAALKRLPEQLRQAARPLMGVEENGEGLDYLQRNQLSDEYAPIVAGLDSAQRIEFFETLCPGLGKALEDGWRLFDRLPYQCGYEAKAFRAPGHDKLLLERRMKWLSSLVQAIGPYPDKNVVWHAMWAAHQNAWGTPQAFGTLFAAAIDAGGKTGDEVFEILCASARGEHEIGIMGRHVTQALLCASRRDGWEFVEKLLLAAQREEGLRQAILESIDTAHPEAFRRMLRLILDQNLVRFSATVRALDVWLGYMWDSVSTGVVNKVMEKLLLFLEDEPARAAALKGKDAEQCYLALWAIAFDNAPAAIAPAAALLQHPKVEFRFAGAQLLSQLGLTTAQETLLTVLDDDDLHLPFCALAPHQYGEMADELANSDLFERLEKLLPRFPEKRLLLKPLIWPWTGWPVDRQLVSSVLINALGKRPATRLIPHLGQLSNHQRGHALQLLAKPDKPLAESRCAFLDWIGDGSRNVRDASLAGLQKCEVTSTDAPKLERLLTRSAGDLRRGVLSLLARQPDAAALASADRLLAAGSSPQRLAGLELLCQLAEAKRCLTEARERAAQYRESRPKLADAERQQIQNIETARAETLTLDNALGLITSHDDRTWPDKPVNRNVALHSPGAVKLIKALDDLVHEHREKTIVAESWTGDTEQKLLGEVRYNFPSPKPELTLDQDTARLPLAEVWEKFWTERGTELRDPDGFELLRAMAWQHAALRGDYHDKCPVFRKRCKAAVDAILGDYKKPEIRYEGVLQDLLGWFLRLHPPAGASDFTLDAMETSFALLPEAELRYVKREDDYRDELWHDSDSPFMAWQSTAQSQRHYGGGTWTHDHANRFYRLLRWADQPFGKTGNVDVDGKPLSRNRPGIEPLLAAHQTGGATDADLFDQLLGTRTRSRWGSGSFADLDHLTSRKGEELLNKHPRARPLVDRCRARVLEVELTRGATPTPASQAALHLSTIHGIQNLVAVLRALGKRNFTRGYARDNDSTETVFSHLARCSFPLPSETPAEFSKQLAAALIPEQRLVELALYAPQWATHVEHALGWKNLVEGVWWIHAHTKGMDWTVDEEIRELWKADLSQRTALTSEELLEGAVDVAWFRRVHGDLGEKRWAMLDEAAKYASTGSGHARARLFADAMLERVKKKELLTRTKHKRHQDAVRALGLLPLAEGKSREADLLERYKVMQEFIRTSRQFGSQRQASEKRAAQIGQENLARTAGYPDPLRLQWAMEARAVADLADGPISVTADGLTVSLGIDSWGEIEFTITKDGKALTDIPPKLKKDKRIAALRERKTELKRQASRIRIALEQFMCRGECVTGAELQDLMKHPLLAPMLGGLVLAGDGILGYPINAGKGLEDYAGNKDALKRDEKVRIAHPVDLLPAAKWHAWQKDCFAKERIQPFKQVFRELYTLTKPEKDEGTRSRRYAGHQVHPRKAMALLGARGWVHHPEEGVRKTYHNEGVTAWIEFDEPFYTPAEIEGLTLEEVHFTQRGGDRKALKLTNLSPRLFSETMRDLDLVVSVAHRGGVDPEASASTLEMRAALVKETCALLRLPNVRIKDNSVLIKGELGEYSVHLGSAIARKIPGETLFIVAVQAQHRGRLFLPFADNDPRTAEVISKVLLLARDKEIRDPSIVSQIRAG